MNRNNSSIVPFVYLLASALFMPCGVVAQDQDAVWAQPQQTALAEEILGCDREQCWDPVFVAEALGTSRMSEGVRVALMKLLERFLDEQDAASAQGIPLEQIVNGEFFLMVAGLVARLKDPRSIPALARVGEYGYGRDVVRGLAAFGERALPAILEAIDTPEVSNFGLGNNLRAVLMVVENVGVNSLVPSFRREIIRVAGEVLRTRTGGPSAMNRAIDLAVVLNDPDLVQVVRSISQDTHAMAASGVSQLTIDLIRNHAIDALASVSGEP